VSTAGPEEDSQKRLHLRLPARLGAVHGEVRANACHVAAKSASSSSARPCRRVAQTSMHTRCMPSRSAYRPAMGSERPFCGPGRGSAGDPASDLRAWPSAGDSAAGRLPLIDERQRRTCRRCHRRQSDSSIHRAIWASSTNLLSSSETVKDCQPSSCGASRACGQTDRPTAEARERVSPRAVRDQHVVLRRDLNMAGLRRRLRQTAALSAAETAATPMCFQGSGCVSGRLVQLRPRLNYPHSEPYRAALRTTVASAAVTANGSRGQEAECSARSIATTRARRVQRTIASCRSRCGSRQRPRPPCSAARRSAGRREVAGLRRQAKVEPGSGLISSGFVSGQRLGIEPNASPSPATCKS
jgi:hypothetical protein